MRASEQRELNKLAYGEYKVTRQISTGNGDAFLAQSEDPPPSFIKGELGYGINERPCTDCHKPCTLDFTLANLDEINSAHLRHLNQKDPLSVPDRITSVGGDVRKHFKLGEAPTVNAYGDIVKPKKRNKMTAKEARRTLRAQARRGGLLVVKGQWVPSNPNGAGRRRDRAEKLIAAHRERQAAASV